MYFIPEVEDEVLVAFERGDLRFPYIVGSLWNGKDKAPQYQRRRQERRPPDQDAQGAQADVQRRQQGARAARAERRQEARRSTTTASAIDDGKGNSIVIKSNSGSITIQAATDLSIKAPKIAIEATGTLDVKAGATLDAQAASLVNIN